MEIKRSEFLRLSAWSFLSFLIPFPEVKAFSFFLSKDFGLNTDLDTALTLAVQAKEHFYKKQYAEAEQLYLECIRLAPDHIQFYDNLENIYGAQSKYILIAELFKNGLAVNRGKPAFYDRAARSLMRIELGYRRQAEEYRAQQNSLDLMGDATQIINAGIALDPDKNYLKITKQKIEYRVSRQDRSRKFNKDKVVKAEKAPRKKRHGGRYQPIDNEGLQDRLQKIEQKKRATLYLENEVKTRDKNILKEKKKILSILSQRAALNKEFENALNYRKQIFNLDPDDAYNFSRIKTSLIRSKQFDELIDLQKTRITREDNLFHYVGLMDAYLKKNESMGINSVLCDEVIRIGNTLFTEWSPDEKTALYIKDKLIDAHLQKGAYPEALEIIRYSLENLETNTAGLINLVLLKYAKVYVYKREWDQAEAILKCALQESQEEPVGLEAVKALVAKRGVTTFDKNASLYYLLAEVYALQGKETAAQDVLQTILINHPQDAFALKRI